MVRRWVPALVLGGVWWWAVLRLVLEPAHAGLVEGAVAAGGWGLSLLPVHVAAAARSAGMRRAGGGVAPGAPGAEDVGEGLGRWPAAAMRWARHWHAVGVRYAVRGRRVTRAWLRRRSGGGSGRS
ncbi:hypothetical protein ACFYZN_18215 [Streptomyces sp. NPDC001777]|uniref:hypothetical protein n=1 Tax=Streptomyces sp. NPDC001777 TaxID=3364608 RepID=UPI0036B5BEB9